MLELFKLAGIVTVDGLKEANKDIISFEKNVKRVIDPVQKFGRIAERTGKTLTKNLTLPLAALGGAAIKFGGDFEKAMVTSTAIMGNVSSEMRKEMEETAKTISKQSTFSADELAKSYYYLASAGYTAEQSVAALGKVAKFAEAGQFDLQVATDLLTDAQSALGLASKDAAENEQNLVRVSDVLVKANTIANASVQQFSEALTNRAGAALRSVGKSVEEGVAVLAAFADQGTKGAEAGTQFSIVMRDLQSSFFKATDEFKEAGIAVFDTSGKMRNMADIIGDVEKALEGKSDAEKKATLANLKFQEKSVASLLTLIGTSEKIREYEENLKSAGGITEDVAEKQLQNFNDQMKILWNRLKVASIELGSVLLPILKDRLLPVLESALEKLEKLALWFQNLPEGIQTTAVAFGFLAAAIGPLLVAVGQLALSIQTLPALLVAGKLALGAFITLAGSAALAVVALTGVIGGLAWVWWDSTKAQRKSNELMKTSEKLMKAQGEEAERLKKIWEEQATELANINRELEQREAKWEALSKFMKEEGQYIKDEKELAKLQKEAVKRQDGYVDGQVTSYNQSQQSYQAWATQDKKERMTEERKDAAREKEISDEKQIAQMEEQLADERERRQIRQQQKDWAVQQTKNTQAIIKWEEKLAESRQDAYDKQQELFESSRINEEQLAEDLDKFINQQAIANKEMWSDRLNMVNSYAQQVGGLFQGLYDNEAIRIDNNYKRQKQAIENSEKTEKEKTDALEKLDEDYDKKRTALQKKQMFAEKAQAIFSIAVNTSTAIVKALPNLILSGFIGALGLAQAGIVASRPIPELAEGGVIKKRHGGVLVNTAEAGEDEGFIPMKKGTASIADAIIGSMRRYDNNVPVGTAAGAGAMNTVSLNVGTLIADDAGIRELERRLKVVRISENNRMGI